MKLRLLGTSLLLAILVASEACEKRQLPAAGANESTPHDGGTIYRRLPVDISTLNPIIASNGYDRLVANYLFTPLIYLDRNHQPIAGLAVSWQISDDGRLYRFALNRHATFSDGTPVRASDVLFTLRKISDPTSASVQISGSFELIDFSRTRVIDDHAIDIAFREPLASQLSSFSDVFVLPQHIYSAGNFRDFNDKAVGSGAYRLAHRDPGKSVTLDRRADYWGHPRPYIQTVVFRVITDHNTAWNALRRGDLDETLMTSDRWLRSQSDLSLKQAVEFRRFYASSYNAIAWNSRSPLLADKEIRRALAMCIPLDSLIRDIYQGTARGISGPFTPDEWSYNEAVPVVPYDPAGAKRIFASRGWVDRDGDGVLERSGKRFSVDFIVFAGSAPTKQLAETLQAEWRRIGLDVNLVLLDGSAAIERVFAGNYDAAYVGWNLDSDPDPYILFHSKSVPPRGQNVVFYSNPEADRLIEKGRRTLDQTERQKLYRRFHEVVAADQPYAWGIQATSKWAMSKRVRGVEVSPGTGFFSWYPGELAWWLDPRS